MSKHDTAWLTGSLMAQNLIISATATDWCLTIPLKAPFTCDFRLSKTPRGRDQVHPHGVNGVPGSKQHKENSFFFFTDSSHFFVAMRISDQWSFEIPIEAITLPCLIKAANNEDVNYLACAKTKRGEKRS